MRVRRTRRRSGGSSGSTAGRAGATRRRGRLRCAGSRHRRSLRRHRIPDPARSRSRRGRRPDCVRQRLARPEVTPRTGSVRAVAASHPDSGVLRGSPQESPLRGEHPRASHRGDLFARRRAERHRSRPARPRDPSPLRRAVLVFHHYLGLTLAEVADRLDIPIGTAKSRLHHATNALRAALDADARSALDSQERPA